MGRNKKEPKRMGRDYNGTRGRGNWGGDKKEAKRTGRDYNGTKLKGERIKTRQKEVKRIK